MILFERFVRDVTFPLISIREGMRGVKKHLEQFEHQQYLPLWSLKEKQWDNVKSMLQYAYDNTLFYKKRFDEHGIKPSDIKDHTDMARIPILTKEDIRDNLQDMISLKYNMSTLVPSYSGGTTGVKINLFYSRDSLPVKQAATYRSEKWTGWNLGQKRMLIWPALQDHEEVQKLRTKLKNILYQRVIMLPAASLNERILEDYTCRIKRERPKIIKGFANPIYIVADYIVQNNIDIEFECNIITTGEPLYAHQRKAIEKAFGGRVFDSYGAREVSLIGQECEMHKGYHVNMECAFVEFINDEGLNTPNGEPGNILITDLVNRGMPFIRYKINDKGIYESGTCECGRGLELFGGIIGRDGDVLKRIDGGMVLPSTFLPYFITEGPPIGKFQVIQDRLDHILIKLTDYPCPDERHFSFYTKTIRKLFGEQVELDFQIVHDIPNEKSGKYRLSKCEIKG